MKSRFVVLFAVMLSAVVPAMAAEKPAAAPASSVKKAADTVRDRAVKEGWPDTPAGLMAYEWVEAFGSGDKAMQAFLETHINPEQLKKRSMSERLTSYRGARERLGSLTLADIDESKPTELTASLLSEDASRHKFVFKVEPQAPYYMISINTFENRFVGHGGGHGGH